MLEVLLRFFYLLSFSFSFLLGLNLCLFFLDFLVRLFLGVPYFTPLLLVNLPNLAINDLNPLVDFVHLFSSLVFFGLAPLSLSILASAAFLRLHVSVPCLLLLGSMLLLPGFDLLFEVEEAVQYLVGVWNILMRPIDAQAIDVVLVLGHTLLGNGQIRTAVGRGRVQHVSYL